MPEYQTTYNLVKHTSVGEYQYGPFDTAVEAIAHAALVILHLGPSAIDDLSFSVATVHSPRKDEF